MVGAMYGSVKAMGFLSVGPPPASLFVEGAATDGSAPSEVCQPLVGRLLAKNGP